MTREVLSITFIILSFVLGILFYVYNPDPIEYKNPKEKEEIVCTSEAKLCPDGTYVGRSGPNCQFICPEDKEKQIDVKSE